ncbi:MAG: tRNA (adenosine(37)-N6)-threonylcarbamoyltransferase complex ATPase subunit type 1 TsaE [Alphaproteobacteria bacterium]|nr:tRNA (adenosine(37)-N6)-threonylcarbamoyltransferase complex ATPase subunit type 1 TsaE [Alphaproteobacteria bacterium]
MAETRFALPDVAATAALAGRIARLVAVGDVLALRGDLGAGKTTFARHVIAALTGAEVEVPSPTFTLVQTYETRVGLVWHFDLYRLERPDDAWELGIEEAFASGISLIEWPERLGALLPEDRLDIRFAIAAGEARSATLLAQGAWRGRLDG